MSRQNNGEGRGREQSNSNGGKKNERKQTSQPGAPQRSNRQTKGNDESGPERKSGTKKGPNSI
jgi:hypothetical protein